jgi:hypothetical protein
MRWHVIVRQQCLMFWYVDQFYRCAYAAQRNLCPRQLFVVSYIVTNFSSLALLIYGNATLGAIVSCAVTPLSFFVFSLHALNPGAQPPNIWDGLSLLGILIGAVLFRVADLKRRGEQARAAEFAEQEEGLSKGGGCFVYMCVCVCVCVIAQLVYHMHTLHQFRTHTQPCSTQSTTARRSGAPCPTATTSAASRSATRSRCLATRVTRGTCVSDAVRRRPPCRSTMSAPGSMLRSVSTPLCSVCWAVYAVVDCCLWLSFLVLRSAIHSILMYKWTSLCGIHQKKQPQNNLKLKRLLQPFTLSPNIYSFIKQYNV